MSVAFTLLVPKPGMTRQAQVGPVTEVTYAGLNNQSLQNGAVRYVGRIGPVSCDADAVDKCICGVAKTPEVAGAGPGAGATTSENFADAVAPLESFTAVIRVKVPASWAHL